MRDNLFIEQMEENTNFNLVFPYHIHHDKLLGNEYYNPEHPDSYHCHRFEDVQGYSIRFLVAYRDEYDKGIPD